MNIVIPMAGCGKRFAAAGYRDPKPFIRLPELDNTTMIQFVISNVTSGMAEKDCKIFLIINPAHFPYLQGTGLLDKPGITVLACPPIDGGQAGSVLRARNFIDNDEPLMIANSDQHVGWHAKDCVIDFLNADDGLLDGRILVFEDDDPKWSYVKVCPKSKDRIVTEVAEKKVIGPYATCGIYLYRRGWDFLDVADQMIAANDRVNGEFYVCPTYKYLIEDDGLIDIWPVSHMHGMGTPEDLRAMLNEFK